LIELILVGSLPHFVFQYIADILYERDTYKNELAEIYVFLLG